MDCEGNFRITQTISALAIMLIAGITAIFSSKKGYEGAFENGKFHGQGVYTYANGNEYKGSYENDMKHGQGVYTWVDGNRYEGAFENGKRHGQGVYTYANGDKHVGGWKGDEMHGKITVIKENSDEIEEWYYYGEQTLREQFWLREEFDLTCIVRA